SVYGFLSLGVGLIVPFAIRASHAGLRAGPPGLFHSRPDAVLFGSRPLADDDARRIGVLSVMMWDWLSGTLVSFGILQLALVWFGFTQGDVWAYWALVGADVSIAPFWALIIARYVRAGARLRLLEIPPLIW